MPREAHIDAAGALQHLVSGSIGHNMSLCYVPMILMDVPTSVIFKDLPLLTPAFLKEVIEKFKGDRMKKGGKLHFHVRPVLRPGLVPSDRSSVRS